VLRDLAVQVSGRPVAVRGADGGVVELAADDLAAAAAAIAGVLQKEGWQKGGRQEGGRREILVLGGALDEPATRALLSWATVAGAALLLEGDPGSVLGAAIWARPTLFAGTADDLAGLRQAAQRQEHGGLASLRRRLHRSPGLPFGRLRTALVTEPGPLPPEEEDFWRRRGVAVRFLPQCGIAWYISRRGDRDA
jgi:hypothetical protein